MDNFYIMQRYLAVIMTYVRSMLQSTRKLDTFATLQVFDATEVVPAEMQSVPIE
jgi:hypothetical protein